MNLYLISQDLNSNYDTYDSAVVAAESEEEARCIHPSPYVTHHRAGEWQGTYSAGGAYSQEPSCDWVNFSDIEQVVVELLGTTDREAGVILASFNAG